MKKIRLNENEFHALIKECVKQIIKENYPPGAFYDSRAPYNQDYDEPNWDELYGDEVYNMIENEINNFDEKFEQFCREKYNAEIDPDNELSWRKYIKNPEVREAYHDYRYDDAMSEFIDNEQWDDMDDFDFTEDETLYANERY